MSIEKLDTSVSNRKESLILLDKMKVKEAELKKQVKKKNCKAVIERIMNGYKITYVQINNNNKNKSNGKQSRLDNQK